MLIARRVYISALPPPSLVLQLRALVDEPAFFRVYYDHPFEGVVGETALDVRPVRRRQGVGLRLKGRIEPDEGGSQISLEIFVNNYEIALVVSLALSFIVAPYLAERTLIGLVFGVVILAIYAAIYAGSLEECLMHLRAVDLRSARMPRSPG
jgi:hypothetical protein